MSQPLKQQTWSQQFASSADLEPARAAIQPRVGLAGPITSLARPQARRQTRQQQRLLTFSVLGLAVSLPALAFLYVCAHANAVSVEYQRQRLVGQINTLRAKNLDLRCALGPFSDLDRVSQFAAAAGMHPADPAAESDFLSLPPSQPESQAQRPAWFSQGPLLVAGLAHQLNLAVASDRAEASLSDANSPRPSQSH